jgi:hypothetical protein
MKTLSKLVAGALLTVGLVAPTYAGGLSAQANSTTPYINQIWTVPSGASGQQVAQCFNGQIINQGPLGYYQLQKNGSVNVSGPVSAGTYNVIVELVPGSNYPGVTSGYSVVVVTW